MIPVCEPWLGLPEQEAALHCLRQGALTQGPHVEEFERQWAAHCTRSFGVAVASGTAALELALAALRLPPGSEVIMPSLTIISCALAALRNHLVPVPVDVDPATWCLDEAAVRRALTARTRALMPVHLFGHPAPLGPLLAIARERQLWVVEDAAQAHGAQWHDGDVWRPCGGSGHLACFSFYGNKLVTTGEGGMIVTDDAALADRLRSLRNLCFGAGAARFRHVGLGHNYRLTNLQAAIGLAQLQRLPVALSQKRTLYQVYRAALPQVRHQEHLPWARSACWMHGIVVPHASRLAQRLQARGVATRPFFTGLHQQAVLRDYLPATACPVTEELTAGGLYLPSAATLTTAQIRTVIQAVQESL